MTMYPPGGQATSEEDFFKPSAEQLERERALKRFNRKFITIPIALVVLIGIVLTILMLVAIFAPGPEGTMVFLSGLADTIVVLWMIPMTVLCAIVPILYFAYLVNRRQRRAELPLNSPLLEHSRTQMAFWKAQNISDRVDAQSKSISDRIVAPFMRLGEFSAYLLAWLTILTQPFRRDDNYDPDGSSDPDGID
ncbi:MAG: hypothetical protein ACK2T4_11690 [Candidatus Promineifilaceae bacterium]|jgi:hypothetical protein